MRKVRRRISWWGKLALAIREFLKNILTYKKQYLEFQLVSYSLASRPAPLHSPAKSPHKNIVPYFLEPQKFLHRPSKISKMPPKKPSTEEPKNNVVAFGRVRKNLKMGCVGLPNVGKSSLFNLLTEQSAAAENYPFCTIEPNEARCAVPDARYVCSRWFFQFEYRLVVTREVRRGDGPRFFFWKTWTFKLLRLAVGDSLGVSLS